MGLRRLVETDKFVNSIVPASRSASTVTGSAWIDTAGYDECTVHVICGDIAATATVAAKLVEADDASGTGAADIAGALIVPLGASDDNLAPTISVRLGGRANRKRFVRPSVTTANAAVAYGVYVQLSGAEQEPVTNSPTPVAV